MLAVPAPRLPRPHRVLARALLAVLLVAGLSGCARVRVALALQPDDTVSGDIVLATPAKGPDDTGPTVTLPPDLASDVDVTRYAQDGYVGSQLRFSHLSFDQVARLTATGPAGNPVQFGLRRAGGRVLVSGAVDLTTVTVDRADFQLKMSSPGQVVQTDGDAEDGTVSWTFTPGEVGHASAVLAYADPHAPSVLNWSLGLAGLVALASLVVVLAARRTRNPPLSPPIR